MKSLQFVILVSALCITMLCNAGQEVKQLSQTQVLSLLNAPKAEPFVILDVRSPEEFAQGHIKGALNISHDQIAQQLNQLEQYKDTIVVVHCRSGRRAQVAESVLLANGFSKLHHLTGDYNGWVAADLPLVK
ncbi:rhodanese-like domain-containing protein [Thalassotalea sp. G2M2-11]|uniref:rhodanese-like domain-containing protein n=1 Tax=Thalassotalea sp. G2M2-11 TaxID=2787627 RepID=UPI0019D19499|nr:rhodanese-like domain-containing protein [Thalassotalea sp. G2M2-11]